MTINPELMADWIQESILLQGELVDLLPMEKYHFDELIAIAGNPKIWEFYAYDGTNQSRIRSILESAMADKASGVQYPFVIRHKKENRLIGSTRFMDIVPMHRKLEIGSTWLLPEFWATAINLECKLLLLTYCFEKLKAVRVQLKTDEKNMRSRKAIEKIGARFEGVLRNDMIRDNQTFRNSAYYSIIFSEWDTVKSKLTDKYNRKKDEMMFAG